MRSGRPDIWSSSALSTWMGEELLNASTPLARVPVTMTVSVTGSSVLASASASWACSSAGVQARLTANDRSASRRCAARGRITRLMTIETSLESVCVARRTQKRRTPRQLRAFEVALKWRGSPRCFLLGNAQGMRPARVAVDVANFRPTRPGRRPKIGARCLTTVENPRRSAKLELARELRRCAAEPRRRRWINYTSCRKWAAKTPSWCARREKARQSRAVRRARSWSGLTKWRRTVRVHGRWMKGKHAAAIASPKQLSPCHGSGLPIAAMAVSG